jgi:hypothetical protein
VSEIRAEIELLYRDGVSAREIARRLGRHHSTVQGHIGRIARAREAALAPLTGVVPEGFHLSGIATTVDKDGNVRSQSYRAKSGEEGDVVPESGSFPAPDGMFTRSVSTLVDGQTGTIKQQWVKADKVKEDQFRAMLEASLRAAERVTARDFVEPPIDVDRDLAQLYTVTDYHFGMLAWGRETGDSVGPRDRQSRACSRSSVKCWLRRRRRLSESSTSSATACTLTV